MRMWKRCMVMMLISHELRGGEYLVCRLEGRSRLFFYYPVFVSFFKGMNTNTTANNFFVFKNFIRGRKDFVLFCDEVEG